MLVWRWPNGATSVQDFVQDGETAALVEEVAAAIAIQDNGEALWRGVAGDMQRENFALREKVTRLEQRIKELDELNDYVLERVARPLAEAVR